MTIAPQQRFSPMAVAGILKKQAHFGMGHSKAPQKDSEAPTAIFSIRSSPSAVNDAKKAAAQLKTIRSAFEAGITAFAQGEVDVADVYFERAITLEIASPNGNGRGASFVIAKDYALGRPNVGIDPNPQKAMALMERLLKAGISLPAIFITYAKGVDGIEKDTPKAMAIADQMLLKTQLTDYGDRIRIAELLADTIGQENNIPGFDARAKARVIIKTVLSQLMSKPMPTAISDELLAENAALLKIAQLKFNYRKPEAQFTEKRALEPVFFDLSEATQALKTWVSRQQATSPLSRDIPIREVSALYTHLASIASGPSQCQLKNVDQHLSGRNVSEALRAMDDVHTLLKDIVAPKKS